MLPVSGVRDSRTATPPLGAGSCMLPTSVGRFGLFAQAATPRTATTVRLVNMKRILASLKTSEQAGTLPGLISAR
jgi:hypothetical protein